MRYYILAIKNYANFYGRTTRKEYWMFVLHNLIIIITLNILSDFIKLKLFLFYYQVAMVLPLISAGVRRMHDVNKSGWNLIIPIINFILLVSEGTIGSNEYGKDPKQEDIELNDHIIDE